MISRSQHLGILGLCLLFISPMLAGNTAHAKEQAATAKQEKRLLDETMALHRESQLLISRYGGSMPKHGSARLLTISRRLQRIATSSTDQTLKIVARRMGHFLTAVEVARE